MIIRLEEQQFTVLFRHGRSPNTGRRTTDCLIFFGDQSGRPVVEIVGSDALMGEGTAECSERDNFCRAQGRGIALERALHDARDAEELRSHFHDLRTWKARFKAAYRRALAEDRQRSGPPRPESVAVPVSSNNQADKAQVICADAEEF